MLKNEVGMLGVGSDVFIQLLKDVIIALIFSKLEQGKDGSCRAERKV